MQELFDEVYMGKNHTPAAVPFELQFIKGITGEAVETRKEIMDAE
jgi:hypothetical protein